MKAAAFRCTSGSSRYQLARFIVDDPPPSLHDHYSHFLAVGSEEAPIEGLASVRHSNGTCSFPAFRFHEWLREVRREGISETRLPCPPESGPSASDLRTSNDRIVSSKCDVRVFHKGNFPSSHSFLIYLDRSKLDPFTNVLPRTTLDPQSPVTRVIRLALQVLLRSPTPGGASL